MLPYINYLRHLLPHHLSVLGILGPLAQLGGVKAAPEVSSRPEGALGVGRGEDLRRSMPVISNGLMGREKEKREENSLT